ncbi:uroporphyrinogen-III synthase [Halobacillus rhizosphaerae]|uniref:uroporphyrinogen-III synthase n=1 Tax=Halobacillus rhizosphaerae TaxID=3064889 RepID=UPI00398A5350
MTALAGKRILNTRGKSQAKSLSILIEQAGGSTIEAPLLSFQSHSSEKNDDIISKLHDYSWVFVTSSNGVKFFFDLLTERQKVLPKQIRWAVVGKKTSRILADYGIEADFMPNKFQAQQLVKEFLCLYEHPGHILFIRGNQSREEIPRMLKEKQVFFQTMTVYDTLPLKDSQDLIHACIEHSTVDALTFTSPSTIDAFMEALGKGKQKALSFPCFCIGPTTGARAREKGFKEIYIPEQYTLSHMVDQIIKYFSNKGV